MAAIATPTVPKAWAPDVIGLAASDVIPEALILQTSTVAGEIEGDAPALRVPFINDATAQFTGEGDVIDEANPTLDEVLVYTGKITQLITLTNEQRRQPNTLDQLDASARRSIIKKANEAYLTQPAPTSPATTPPPGLLNIPGLIEGEALGDNLDGLIDLIAQLESSGGTPSQIVLDPIGWATLRKVKAAAGSNANLLGAGTTDAARILLDLPVMVAGAMPAGQGLVLDRSAIASAVGDLQVATSDHAMFTRDSVMLRATWRLGWNVVHPDRLGKFTVTAADAQARVASTSTTSKSAAK